jgi:hypothetical protein
MALFKLTCTDTGNSVLLKQAIPSTEELEMLLAMNKNGCNYCTDCTDCTYCIDRYNNKPRTAKS